MMRCVEETEDWDKLCTKKWNKQTKKVDLYILHKVKVSFVSAAMIQNITGLWNKPTNKNNRQKTIKTWEKA